MTSITNSTCSEPQNDGSTSNIAVIINNDNGKSATGRRGNSKGSKERKKPDVKSYKTVSPKLIMVKSLVESQPTSELQSQLFALAESNLDYLLKIVK